MNPHENGYVYYKRIRQVNWSIGNYEREIFPSSISDIRNNMHQLMRL